MNRFWRRLRHLLQWPRLPGVSDALAEGNWTAQDGTAITLSLHALGNLVLPTGRIVACDPFIVDDPPFTRSVAPGRYPVLVNVARINTDSRVAYAIVRFSEAKPVRWEKALYPERAYPLDGYGVDSGTGCFADAAAAAILAERSTTDDGNGEIGARMAERYVDTWSWTNSVLDPDTGANVVAFSSGWGDGVYPSYWGLDPGGAPVCLVTDFKVFNAFASG